MGVGCCHCRKRKRVRTGAWRIGRPASGDIASGRREGVLLELAAGKKLGTRFSLR